jgi:Na+-translocating ferredoxin:NAD+ oxidoreductase subunit C
VKLPFIRRSIEQHAALETSQTNYLPEVVQLGPPEELRFPVDLKTQWQVAPAGTRVRCGDRLLRPVAGEATGLLAPLSGTVGPLRVFDGETYLELILDAVTQDSVHSTAQLNLETFLSHVRDCGLRGMGGAGFPTFKKLSTAVLAGARILIINAVECEPDIASDRAVLRERTHDVQAGAAAICELVSIQRCVLAVREGEPGVELGAAEVLQVPSGYPGGDERQLVPLVTGETLRIGARPTDVGCLVLNVATVAALGVISRGELPSSRLVSVRGDHVSRPVVVEVLIGTPVRDVLAQLKIDSTNARVSDGGAMMNRAVHSLDVPLMWSTIGLKVQSRPTRVAEARPCIRCGWCEPACPYGLSPQQMWLNADSSESNSNHRIDLEACTACGACDGVCPSAILLSEQFKKEKAQLNAKKIERELADSLRDRFERHLGRTAARQAARALRVRQEQGTVTANGAERRERVAAMLEGAKRRRQSPPAKSSS